MLLFQHQTTGTPPFTSGNVQVYGSLLKSKTDGHLPCFGGAPFQDTLTPPPHPRILRGPNPICGSTLLVFAGTDHCWYKHGSPAVDGQNPVRTTLKPCANH